MTDGAWRPSFRWGLALVVLVAVSSVALVSQPASGAGDSGRQRVMQQAQEDESESLLPAVTNVTITTSLGGLLGLVEVR